MTMTLRNLFFTLVLVGSVNVSYADTTQYNLQNKGALSSSSKKVVSFLKDEDYKLVRKKLISNGWKSYGNPYLDKSTSEVQAASNLNKSLGFSELQQCFSRGINLFSCDVTWTSTGNKENPELILGVLIDMSSRRAYLEDDAKSN